MEIIYTILEILVVIWAIQFVVGLLGVGASPGLTRTRPVYDGDLVRIIIGLVVVALILHFLVRLF